MVTACLSLALSPNRAGCKSNKRRGNKTKGKEAPQSEMTTTCEDITPAEVIIDFSLLAAVIIAFILGKPPEE